MSHLSRNNKTNEVCAFLQRKQLDCYVKCYNEQSLEKFRRGTSNTHSFLLIVKSRVNELKLELVGRDESSIERLQKEL